MTVVLQHWFVYPQSRVFLSATSWCGDSFPLTQIDSAVVFAVCSSAAFWPKQMMCGNATVELCHH